MDYSDRVIKDLTHLLADTYTLYTKTQFFHWNVTGELFFMWHAAFEKQYEELAEAVDLLAERLRALHEYAPCNFEELTDIKPARKVIPAMQMVQELLRDHEHLIKKLQTMITTAEEAGDQATMDMMIERQTYHQKTAWMLRSSLKD